MGLLTYGTGLNAGELFNYAWSWIKYLGGWAIYVLILVGVFLLGILVVNIVIHGWKVNNFRLGLGDSQVKMANIVNMNRFTFDT